MVVRNILSEKAILAEESKYLIRADRTEKPGGGNESEVWEDGKASVAEVQQGRKKVVLIPL